MANSILLHIKDFKMCLSIPAKIIRIENNMADVDIGGNIKKIGLHLLEDPMLGDYVLIHAGFAIQVISDEEAKETIERINTIYGD